MLSLLFRPWFLWGVCVLCLHIESPSTQFTQRDGHREEGGVVVGEYSARQGKEATEKGRRLLKETTERSDRVFGGSIRGRGRVRRYVGDGHVSSAPLAGSTPLADEAPARAPSVGATVVHYEQLMILKTTDADGEIVGCTFSQRLQSSRSQRSQLARWWRRTRGAVERPASVSGFLDVVERCLETEVPAPRTSWTFGTLLNVIAPGTMWCGLGTLASDMTQLGSRSGTDRCCQIHDLCPVQLIPFVGYRGVMTAGPKTLSHCDCDRRFADCLRKVNSMGSRGVFHAYFNLAFQGNMCVTDDYLSGASNSLLSGIGRALRMLMRVSGTDEEEVEQKVEEQKVEKQKVEVEQNEERQQVAAQKVEVKQRVEGKPAAIVTEKGVVTAALGENLVNAATGARAVATTPPTTEEGVVATTQDENSSTTTTTTDQAFTTTEENVVTTSPGENFVSTTPSEGLIYTSPGEEFTQSPEYNLVSTGPGAGGFVLKEPEGSSIPIEPEGSIVPMEPQGNLVPISPEENSPLIEPVEDSLVFIRPEGNVISMVPQRNLVPVEPEGSYVFIESGASSLPVEPEDNLIPMEPGGNLRPTEIEGILVPIYPEESLVPIYLEESLVPTEPEGSLVLVEPEGGLLLIRPEGSLFPTGPQGSFSPIGPEGALIPKGLQRNSVPMGPEGNFPLTGLDGLLHSPIKGKFSTDLDELPNTDGSVASGSRRMEAEEPEGILLSRLNGFTKPAEVRSASPEIFSSLNEVGKTSSIVLDCSDETCASSEPNTETSAGENLKKTSPSTEASSGEPTVKPDINKSNIDVQEPSSPESRKSITVDVQSSEAEKSISKGVDVYFPSALSPEADSDTNPDVPFDPPEGEIEAASKYEEIPLHESPIALDLEALFPHFSQDFFEAIAESEDESSSK